MTTIHIEELETEKSTINDTVKKKYITKQEFYTIISNKINKLDILLQKNLITKKDYDYTKSRIYDLQFDT